MPAAFTAADLVTACRGVCSRAGLRTLSWGSAPTPAPASPASFLCPWWANTTTATPIFAKALGRGVRGLVVAERARRQNGLIPPLPRETTAVAVADTLQALGDLARTWRRRFPIPVVSLTGSCGKTTAKEMIALILARYYRVLKNDLNLNNLIGLPQTLLQLDGTFEAAVVEMGMNRFGEIRRLTEISQPTVGVLLNIYPAHTEGVGSVEGVARAKGEIIAALSRECDVGSTTPTTKSCPPGRRLCRPPPGLWFWCRGPGAGTQPPLPGACWPGDGGCLAGGQVAGQLWVSPASTRP